jgi:ligand-binding SRPBCC domain-containing protein
MARRGDRWLSSADQVVSGEVAAPPAVVRAFYCDLDNLTALHPLIVSVESIRSDHTDDSVTQIYRVRDRIPVGAFTVGITYTTRVHAPAVGDVLTEARQFPRVVLHGRVSFEQVDGGTRVTERLTIEAPRPLVAVTAKMAVTAHAEMLAGIARCFR